MPDAKLDFSVRNVPDSWSNAAEEAPTGPSNAPRNRQAGHRVPTGTRPDLVTGFLTGVAMTICAGAAWYSMIISDYYKGPWLAVLMGVLVAVAVRLGAGPAGPEMRVGVGAALYLAGVLGVACVASYEQFSALNRRSPSFGELEDLVTSLYLRHPVTVIAWVLGMGVMAWMTFALKHTRR